MKEFVVPKFNEYYLMDSIKYPPHDYYAPNNIIIIESDQKIYFHANWNSCGTGWKVSNPPMEIDFKQHPLLIFKNIDSLLQMISKSEQSIKLIMFASNADTIRNPLYFELRSRIQKTDGMYEITTRKITKDEDLAIKNNYTIKWSYYNPK